MPTKPSGTSSAPKVEAPSVSAPLAYENIEANMTAVTALSPEGKQYVEELTRQFERRTSGRVTVEKIPHRIESIACIDNAAKQAIIIIFNESFVGTQANIPATEYMPDIKAAFKSRHEDIAVVQYELIARDSYSRVENMAVAVDNAFKSLAPNARMTAQTFAGMRLTPTTSLEQAKKFVMDRSPHATLERADWGILLNQVTNNERMQSYQSSREPDLHPIMAILGYTKFIRVNMAGIPKWQPIAVITNVTSTVPSVDMMMLALPVAAGCVIMQRLWERPYMRFSDPKSPNLGRLKPADNGEGLDWFPNIEKMRAEMPKFIIDTPLLALDCAEGRVRIPGSELYAMQGPDGIMQQLSDFYGPESISAFAGSGQNPIMMCYFNYEGEYTSGGQKLDTRCVDFINAVTETQDPQRCTCFCDQSMIPTQHLADVSAIYGEDAVTPMYRVHTVVFNGTLINILANLLGSVVQYKSETAINQTVDMAALLGAGITPIGGNNAIYGSCGYDYRPASIYGL